MPAYTFPADPTTADYMVRDWLNNEDTPDVVYDDMVKRVNSYVNWEDYESTFGRRRSPPDIMDMSGAASVGQQWRKISAVGWDDD